ncbi:hypothetical protein OE88DRAFT_1805908 [Heliocybe sulcata]|uniref:Conidiation protein 6 n=1 Tax=Heliocybe sulcata TaxID=5364 RepID=A0A5C3N8E4_9AGAM|nr:hypothetical protein OE88DRAFT_1805908 [Heliocybe sulcata]
MYRTVCSSSFRPRTSVNLTRTFMTSRANRNGDPNRVAGGYKATLNNPRVSEEAKGHAAEALEDIGNSGATGRSGDKHETRVNAGLKAAMHNPNVSKEAKRDAEHTLKEKGAI